MTALQFLVKCVCSSQSKDGELCKRCWSLSYVDLEKKNECFVAEFTLWILTGKEPPSLKVAYHCSFKAH